MLVWAWLCLASHQPFLLCYSLGKSLAWRSTPNPGGQGRERKVRVPLLCQLAGLGIVGGRKTASKPRGGHFGAQGTRTTQSGMGYPGSGEVTSKLLRIVSSDTCPLQLSLRRVCSSRDPDESPQVRLVSWGSVLPSLLCSVAGSAWGRWALQLQGSSGLVFLAALCSEPFSSETHMPLSAPLRLSWLDFQLFSWKQGGPTDTG